MIHGIIITRDWKRDAACERARTRGNTLQHDAIDTLKQISYTT